MGKRWAGLWIGLLHDEYQDFSISLIKHLEPASDDLVQGSGTQGCEVCGFLFQDSRWLQAAHLC